jgi:hypothetical protein
LKLSCRRKRVPSCLMMLFRRVTSRGPFPSSQLRRLSCFQQAHGVFFVNRLVAYVSWSKRIDIARVWVNVGWCVMCKSFAFVFCSLQFFVLGACFFCSCQFFFVLLGITTKTLRTFGGKSKSK